jgi:hypothetical protein
MTPHAPIGWLVCPKCRGNAHATAYIVPGSLGTIYEYEQGHCAKCGETITSEQVQEMMGDSEENNNKEPIDLYADGKTAQLFWEVQRRTYPKNFIRRPFRWRKS